MENTLKSVIDMIDRVLVYVKQVVSGEVEGNEKIGKYLLDTLSETSDTVGIEKGQLDVLFNSHLQVRSGLFILWQTGWITSAPSWIQFHPRIPSWSRTLQVWCGHKLRFLLALRWSHRPPPRSSVPACTPFISFTAITKCYLCAVYFEQYESL